MGRQPDSVLLMHPSARELKRKPLSASPFFPLSTPFNFLQSSVLLFLFFFPLALCTFPLLFPPPLPPLSAFISLPLFPPPPLLFYLPVLVLPLPLLSPPPSSFLIPSGCPSPLHIILPLSLLFLYSPSSPPSPLARSDPLVLNSPHLLPVRDPPPAQSPLVPAESTGRAGRRTLHHLGGPAEHSHAVSPEAEGSLTMLGWCTAHTDLGSGGRRHLTAHPCMARPPARPPPARLARGLCHTLPAGIRPGDDLVGAQGGGRARGTPTAEAGTSKARARNPARVLRLWPGRRETRSGLQDSAHRGVNQPRMEAGSRDLGGGGECSHSFSSLSPGFLPSRHPLSRAVSNPFPLPPTSSG